MEIKSAVLAAIGDELLSGARLEKNCNFMAKNFHNKGVELKRIEIISDEEDEIINLLSRWVGKTDLLIISGGLGPTHDDKTRYAIAKFLDCDLYPADEIYDKVVERVKNNPKRLEYTERCRDPQAMIPKLAAPVFNPTGFALGINFEKDGTKVLALPGVPMEYESMTRQELPEIFSQDSQNYAWTSIIILDVPEIKIADKIPEVIKNKNLHVSILPAFPQVELIIRGEPSEVEDAEKIIRERFPDALPKNCTSIAEAVLIEAINKKLKISCAESCTGGLVGAALTEIPGSSESFNGSVVTYSNEAKIKILGVREDTLKNFGAVSEQCAREMSEGSLKIYDSDFAISTTGIAGPDGGTELKPVGTVCFGIASRNKTKTCTVRFPGNRQEIRTRAVRFILAELYKTLKNK